MGQLIGNATANAAGVLAAPGQYKIDKARVDAARMMQASGNQLEAAQSSLSETIRTIGNKRRLNAGGENMNTTFVNMARTVDSMDKGSQAQQLAASAEMGAFMASTAASGKGGSTVAQLRNTFRAQAARDKGQADKAKAAVVSDGKEQASSFYVQAVQGLDNTQRFAQMDYTKFVDPHKPMSPLAVFAMGGLGVDANNQGNMMIREAAKGNFLGGAVNYGRTFGETAGAILSFMVGGVGGAAAGGAFKGSAGAAAKIDGAAPQERFSLNSNQGVA